MTGKMIYRYALQVDDFPEIIMPRGAQVLSVAPDRGGQVQIDLWALVDPTAPLEPRKFCVIGTGNLIRTDLGRFIGTVSLLKGNFIGHVFEAAT